jgi:small conductance mechanosensitive channel
MNEQLYGGAIADAKQSADTVTEMLGLNIKLLTWDRLLAAVVSLIVCVIAIHLIMRILRRVVQRSHLSESLGRFLLQLGKIALEFVTILIVAGSLGFDVTALLAVFSLLGLALTLSVQNSLTNLMSGIVILVTKPFVVGEYIESGGVAGTVRQIGLFYTQMTTLDNKAIYVPNSELSATKIINYTREPNRRVDLVFGAGYDYRPRRCSPPCARWSRPSPARFLTLLPPCTWRTTPRATSSTSCASGAGMRTTGTCITPFWRQCPPRSRTRACRCRTST